MTVEVDQSARSVADQLQDHGHAEEAERIRGVVHTHGTGPGLLHALDDVCQTVLTAIEAIDPASAGLIDELRMEIDKHLR